MLYYLMLTSTQVLGSAWLESKPQYRIGIALWRFINIQYVVWRCQFVQRSEITLYFNVPINTSAKHLTCVFCVILYTRQKVMFVEQKLLIYEVCVGERTIDNSTNKLNGLRKSGNYIRNTSKQIQLHRLIEASIRIIEFSREQNNRINVKESK